MIKIHYPSREAKYKINITNPILLRTACSAGVNRSATVREFLKNNIHQDSIILPQYGAYYGDYEMIPITNFETREPDGFVELFGVNKAQNIQSIIFGKLGYPKVPDFTIQNLDMNNKYHIIKYKEEILSIFWNINTDLHNIFIVINEDIDTIDTVIKRLNDTNITCDLVIIKEKDCIYDPYDEYDIMTHNIASQSIDAYNLFLKKIESYFEFI